jgi:hypothetical protein
MSMQIPNWATNPQLNTHIPKWVTKSPTQQQIPGWTLTLHP